MALAPLALVAVWAITPFPTRNFSGPIDAAPHQQSSERVTVLCDRTPPTEMMFFAHACGRELRGWLVAPALLWLCVIGMSREIDDDVVDRPTYTANDFRFQRRRYLDVKPADGP